MEAIKNIILWFMELTYPLRNLKYGEDGKYIHLLIGAIVVSVAIIVALIRGSEGLNFVGMSLLALEVGILIEVAQRILGGSNTLKESVLDVSWTWLGGSLIALVAVYADIARWAW